MRKLTATAVMMVILTGGAALAVAAPSATPKQPTAQHGQHRGHGDRLKKLDTNNDGKLSLDEFKAAKDRNGQPITADQAQARFNRMDTNKDGFITKEDRPAPGNRPHPGANASGAPATR